MGIAVVSTGEYEFRPLLRLGVFLAGTLFETPLCLRFEKCGILFILSLLSGCVLLVLSLLGGCALLVLSLLNFGCYVRRCCRKGLLSLA